MDKLGTAITNDERRKARGWLYAFLIAPILIVISVYLLQRVVYWILSDEFGAVEGEVVLPYGVLSSIIVASAMIYLVSKRFKCHHLRRALLTSLISIVLFLIFVVAYSVIHYRSINFLFDDYFKYYVLDATFYTGLGGILVGSLFGASLAILSGKKHGDRDVTELTSPRTYFTKKILVYSIITTFFMYVLEIISWILAFEFHTRTPFLLIALLNPIGSVFDKDFFEFVVRISLPATFFYFLMFIAITTIGINGIRLNTGMVKKIFYFFILLIPVAIHVVLDFFVLMASSGGI